VLAVPSAVRSTTFSTPRRVLRHAATGRPPYHVTRILSHRALAVSELQINVPF
jgi:hypothetical protein